jgi:hypothetical protein
MKERGRLLIVFLLIGSAYPQNHQKNDPESQTSKPKLAEVYVDDTHDPKFIRVDGVWEPDNPTKQNELVFTVIRIACYRHGGQVIVGTDPFCVSAEATPIGATLHVDSSFLPVAVWNSTQIMISDDSPICAISQTTFDLTSKTAVGLDIRKPNAKGYLDMCKAAPDRQTYYLRDKVDYALNHQSAKQ